VEQCAQSLDRRNDGMKTLAVKERTSSRLPKLIAEETSFFERENGN
jgi:hypothetical protein